MNKNIIQIREKLISFYEDTSAMPDMEKRMDDYLFSQIINDLHENGIKNFGDWLEYYSSDGNNFEEILIFTESYYYKVLRSDFASISMDEKIMIYNAIGLYCIEMETEKPEGKLLATIISTFIEIIRHYNLFKKGYLSLRGELFISDRSKSQFFAVWSTGETFKRELPVTLFSKT